MYIKKIVYKTLILLALFGCSGEDGNNTPNGGAQPPPPSPPMTASLAGTLAVGEGQVLDGDTNDPNDPTVRNDTPADAQAVVVPITIGGYANEANDEFDLYRITVQSPMTIVLSIAEPEAGDLDLFLADTTGMVLDQSIGTGRLEIIETDAAALGEFLVAVRAFDGASNYTLSLGTTTISATTLGALQRDRQYLNVKADFVVDEVIVKPKTLDTVQSQAMDTALSHLGLARKIVSPTGPQLMSVSSEVSPFAAQSHVKHDASPLYYQSEKEAEKIRTLEILKKLRRNPNLEYAEPNYISYTTALPNDQYVNLQWHYPLINLPQAWDITTGSNDIVVAVIDTGVITTHPDLASRMLRNTSGTIIGFDFISDSTNARDGDGIDPDAFDVGDLGLGTSSSFHGTHVAGTIAAATNNGIGVAGVTWDSRIMPLRVLGLSGGTDFDIAQAILYATGAPNMSGTVPPVRADVINMSLGPPCVSQPLSDTRRAALTAARDAGVVVVIAAGNDNCDIPTPMSTFPGVISVSAVDLNGRKAPYSNFGTEIDVAAPGGDTGVDRDGNGVNDGVLSTLGDDSGSSIQSAYQIYQGTSMAAPHIAGVVALMLAVNPDLTPDDINRLLDGTHADPDASPITRDLGVPGRDDVYGHGLIDAFQAVTVARNIAGGGGGNPPPGDAPVLTVSPQSLNFGTTVTTLQLILSNAGASALEVLRITTDVPWLAIDTEDFPTLTATVNRSNLPVGTSLGNLSIESNGGNRTVQVSVQGQQNVSGGDVGTIFVLVVDPNTLDTVAQTMTDAGQGYVFQTVGFATGSYVVVAGSDRDNDGLICDPGEACGIFPLLDSPLPVEANGEVMNVDFSVSFDFSISAEATAQSARTRRLGVFKRLGIIGGQ